MFPTFTPIADHALLVEFGTEISDAANAAVVALDRTIARHVPPGVIEVVPAFVNLLVDFDPTITDHVAVEAALRELAARPAEAVVTPTSNVSQKNACLLFIA